MDTIDSTLQLPISFGWQQDSHSSFAVTSFPHVIMAITWFSDNISFSEKPELSDKYISPHL
jgi:hypothetical protein